MTERMQWHHHHCPWSWRHISNDATIQIAHVRTSQQNSIHCQRNTRWSSKTGRCLIMSSRRAMGILGWTPGFPTAVFPGIVWHVARQMAPLGKQLELIYATWISESFIKPSNLRRHQSCPSHMKAVCNLLRIKCPENTTKPEIAPPLPVFVGVFKEFVKGILKKAKKFWT